VRYIVAPKDHPVPRFAELVRRCGRFWLYRVQTPGDAALVDSSGTLAGPQHDFYNAAAHWKGGPWRDEGDHLQVAIGSGNGDQALADFAHERQIAPFMAAHKTLAVSLREPEHYIAHTDADRAELFMVRENYHPLWRARLDGQEVAPVMAMPGFVAVPTPAGQHTVELYYAPPWWRTALLAAGALTLLGL
jgi:hypothetical protein